MSVTNEPLQAEQVVVQVEPYRRAWFKSAWDGRAQPVSDSTPADTANKCDECWGPLRQDGFETYCGVCGLVHRRQVYWERSLDIEAGRRQFDHDSEDGSGTLQDRHVVVVEDSAGETTFDGSKLDYNVYPYDQYNAGRDGHRGRENDVQKLDRHRRFLERQAEALATKAGLTGEQVQEVIRIVTSINSGAFTYYGPNRKGGGQDAHILAAIAFVGNKYRYRHPDFAEFDERIQSREEFQSVMEDVGMSLEDVRGAVRQLRKQLSEGRG